MRLKSLDVSGWAGVLLVPGLLCFLPLVVALGLQRPYGGWAQVRLEGGSEDPGGEGEARISRGNSSSYLTILSLSSSSPDLTSKT